MIEEVAKFNPETTSTKHLGCEDHPTICKTVTIDFSKHTLTFTTLVKGVGVSRIILTFAQMRDVSGFITENQAEIKAS